MKRKFRLTSSLDFKRVRQNGKSYSHPLIVLIVLPNERSITRFGIAAGRSVGGAVARNRAKRRIREALRPMLEAIAPGWDGVLIARKPITDADFDEISKALSNLMARAGINK